MAVAGPMSMAGVHGPTLGSAAGLISMLEEEQVQLQTTALRSLNKVVDTHWAEVAGSISVIEAMYEDEFFAQRDLAALLASKVRPRGGNVWSGANAATGGNKATPRRSAPSDTSCPFAFCFASRSQVCPDPRLGLFTFLTPPVTLRLLRAGLLPSRRAGRCA